MMGLEFLGDSLGIDCFHRVVGISLSGPTYTDATIDPLCKLGSLQSVSLNGTKITDAGLNRLMKSRPNCKITRVGG